MNTYSKKSAIRIVGFVLSVFGLSMSSPGFGEDKPGHEIKEERSGVEALSSELREVLKKEMLALEKGMMSVIPAYVSGDWSEIESIAHKMKESYILKQSLTGKQVNELHMLLPDSFIQLDHQFHYLSGMLEQAAKNGKAELVGFYFSKLSETCVSCHSQYAKHKFPAFSLEKETSKHTH